MLYYAVIFILVALLAGALGFGAVAGLAATIAKVLLVAIVVFVIVAAFTRRRPRK